MDLRKLHDTTTEAVLAIKGTGINTDSWDPFLIHILISKLNKDTIKHYECQLNNIKEVSTLKEFLTYVESRSLAIAASESKFNTNSNNNNNNNSVSEKSFKCSLCEESHGLAKCKKFLKKEISAREEWLKAKNLCKNCFGNHKLDQCTSKYTCRNCKKKHHTLLHSEGKSVTANIAKKVETSSNSVENEKNLY